MKLFIFHLKEKTKLKSPSRKDCNFFSQCSVICILPVRLLHYISLLWGLYPWPGFRFLHLFLHFRLTSFGKVRVGECSWQILSLFSGSSIPYAFYYYFILSSSYSFSCSYFILFYSIFCAMSHVLVDISFDSPLSSFVFGRWHHLPRPGCVLECVCVWVCVCVSWLLLFAHVCAHTHTHHHTNTHPNTQTAYLSSPAICLRDPHFFLSVLFFFCSFLQDLAPRVLLINSAFI